jgi:hypothetical protein
LNQTVENVVTLATSFARPFLSSDTVKPLWALVSQSKTQALRRTAAGALGRVLLADKQAVLVRDAGLKHLLHMC